MATNFLPEVWSAETQRLLHEKLRAEKPIYSTITDYSSLTKNVQAGAYHGPMLGDVTGQSMPISDEKFTELAKSTFNMPFGNSVGVPVVINDITAAQSILAIRQVYGQLAVDAIIDNYDKAAIEEMIDETPALNRIAPADTVNGTLGKADFIVAHKKLNEAKAPRTNRYCVIGPEFEAQLYNISDFISRDKIADTSALSAGAVGKLLGFEVILLPDMPKVDSDGDVAALGTGNVAVFYHSSCAGFGRNLEFGAREESKAGIPGTMVNIFSVYGVKIHPGALGKRIVTVIQNLTVGS